VFIDKLQSQHVELLYDNMFVIRCVVCCSVFCVLFVVRLLELQLQEQYVPITTKAVSSNPVHGEVHSIQQYMIKFVSDLRQVGGNNAEYLIKHFTTL
jgi:hypothetical protein